MNSLKLFALAGIASAFLVTGAKGAVILPGGVLNPPPNAAPLGNVFTVAGASFKNFTGVDSSGNTVFTGTASGAAYSYEANVIPGGLTFVYGISNDLSSVDRIDQVTLSGFAGFTTDVGYISDGVSYSPTSITRSADGSILRFNFAGNDIKQGNSSTTLVVRTNAPFAIPNTISIIDGGVATVAGVGPSVAGGTGTPEPASLGVLALGGVMLLRRRRFV